MNLKLFVALTLVLHLACGTDSTRAQDTSLQTAESPTVAEPIVCAAERLDEVMAALGDERVGMVVNHTSLTAGGGHLVDSLLARGAKLQRVFAPEHGFRGTASDGETVANETDAKTGLPVVSLYGRNKRPTAAMLSDLDVLVFDIQDAGLRFYTYISTMHLVMDAAAEYGKRVVVLDRPNPNGHLVDGPVLDPAYRSFIGMHEVPVAHGLTVGELAQMINGEGWLEEGRRAELTVLPVSNYRVGDAYALPVAPSPNLPNARSISLYPTLCFFEGTVASIGRGTDFAFQVVGHPRFRDGDFAFTPEARPGAKYAKLRDERCYGFDLRDAATATIDTTKIDWAFLAEVARRVESDDFIDRDDHFDACAGTDRLRMALESGSDLSDFSESYQEELALYMARRQPYLMYERN